MKVIDQWPVPRLRGTRDPAVIQLLAGDLSDIPIEHAVDALVVSAFPNSYTPNKGTLFESLFKKGLDMRHVARRKAEDERSRLGCWLSKALPRKTANAFHFSRIICFEPRHPRFVKKAHIDTRNLEDAVAFVFRCLNNFVIPGRNGKQRFKLSRLAMPLLATGNQAVPVKAMFPRLLEAAVFWLEEGLPVDQLKIVAFAEKDVTTARRIFERAKSGYRKRTKIRAHKAALPARVESDINLAHRLTGEAIQACKRHVRDELMTVASGNEKALLRRLFEKTEGSVRLRADAVATTVEHRTATYDFFISYAHKQEVQVRQFVQALRGLVPNARVFFDRTSIPPGGQWIKMLSDAVQNAGVFVAILSPDYTASPVCWDEFQCAKLKEYNARKPVIKTVRLYSQRKLPPIMGIYSYIDCAEGNLRKLRRAASTILSMPSPSDKPLRTSMS